MRPTPGHMHPRPIETSRKCWCPFPEGLVGKANLYLVLVYVQILASIQACYLTIPGSIWVAYSWLNVGHTSEIIRRFGHGYVLYGFTGAIDKNEELEVLDCELED